MYRLHFIALLLFVACFASVGHCATSPSLDESTDSVTVLSGDQSLTVRLDDASLIFDSPAGKIELIPEIESVEDAKLMRAQCPPKTYRGKTSVAALIVFPLTDGRALSIHIDGYQGTDAVFVTSSLTASFSGNRDYYRWKSSNTFDRVIPADKPGAGAKLPSDAPLRCKNWVLLPQSDSGTAVYTNGIVGFDDQSPYVEALPKYRYLRGEETLDIGIGFANARHYAEALAAFNSARNKSIPALKRDSATTQDYGAPAPRWLNSNRKIAQWNDDISADSIVVGVPAERSHIEKIRENGGKAIVRIDITHFANPYKQTDADPDGLLNMEKHPEWACIAKDGSRKTAGSQVVPCLHQPELREALLTVICNVMNLGADGVLLDGVFPIPECSGPEFDKHEHANSKAGNTDQLDNLCREIYKLVKSIGQDKVTLLNSGGIGSLWPFCDGQIWDESAFDATNRAYMAEENREALRRGKVMISLSLKVTAHE